MKESKTRTGRLSDERHSLVFQQQLEGELHVLKEALQLDDKCSLRFSKHSNFWTPCLNVWQHNSRSEFLPIFWISNIWPKMRRISNIEQNFRSSQYPYVHKNRSIFTGKIDFVAQRNWFATFVAKYIHVIHFFYKGEFHFESWLKRIIQHKKRSIKEERQIIYTKYKKTVALVIVNVRTKYLTNNQQQI